MPTIDEQLSNLTISVDELTAAVLVKRSELNAAVATAEFLVSNTNISNSVSSYIETSGIVDDAVLAGLAASDKISSNTAPVGGSLQVTNIIVVSQAQYDALDIKNATTLYVIL